MKKLTKLLILFCLMFSVKGAAATIYFNKVLKATGTTYGVNTQSLTGLQDILGYSYKIVSAVPGDVTFASGNNENVILYYVNSSGVQISIPGTISRQSKQGSTTQGVNFIVATNATYTAYTGEAYILALPSFESIYTNGGTASTSSDPIDNVLNAILTSQASKPVINSSISSVSVLENAGYAVFTFSLSNAPTGSYSFSPYLTGVTAVSGTDFTNSIEYLNGSTWQSVSGSLTITSLALSFQLRVPIINYNTSLTDKTFNVNTGLITGGGILNNYGSYGVGTILVPVISTSGSLTAFSTCTGFASSQQSFTVSGVNLVGNLVVTPPAGYEVSTTSGGTFTPSVSLTPTSNSVASTTIYVRLTASAVNNASGNIVCSSTSAVSKNVATTASSVSSTSVAGTISGATTVCTGTNSTALTLNGSVGTIQWQSSNALAGTYSNIGTASATYTATNLTSTTYYRAVVTSGVCSAATTSVVTMTVNPSLPASVSIGASATTICSGTSVTFTASPINGGTTPSYQWKVNGGNVGTNSSTFTSTTLANNDAVTVIMTSNASPCLTGSPATSNSVTMTVNALPTITLGYIDDVSGTATTFSIPYTSSTGSPNKYSITTASNSANSIAMTGFTPVTNATLGSSPIAVTIPASSVAEYGFNLTVTNSSTGCYSVYPFQFHVTSINHGVIGYDQTICSGTTAATLTNVTSGSTSGGATITYTWEKSTTSLDSGFNTISGATSESYAPGVLTQTTYFKRVAHAAIGTSDVTSDSDPITITVNPTSVSGTISGATTVCSGTNSTVLTLNSNVGTIQWQSSNAIAGTYSNIDGATSTTYTANNLTATTYFKAVVTSGVCSSATTSAVTMTVSPSSVAGSISGATTVCSGTNSTVLTLGGNTGTIQWQSSDALAGTYSNIGATATTYTATNLTATTYYRAVVTSGVCSAAISSVVTITVNSATVPTFNAIAPTCSGATLSALPTTSTNSITGTWSPALNNLATTTYTFTPTVGQCATTKTMAITVNSPITPTFTQVDAITLGNTLSALPTTSNNSITGTWSPALNNSTTTTYTFSPNEGQCANTTTMTIAVNATSTPIASAQTLCSGATVSDLTATGSNLKWYLNATGGSSLASNIALTTRTYYVSQTLSGTESERTSVSVVVVSTLGSIATISGLNSLCGVASTTYSIPAVANATGYIWTFPAGIVVTSSLGRTVSVIIDPTFSEGELTVTANNSCGTTATRIIKVYKKPEVSAITGLASICGSTTANYSVVPQANTTYEWSVPTGLNIISGQGTAAISVEVNAANFVYGIVNVRSISNCGVSNKSFFAVYGVQTPSVITGLNQLCNVTSTTYSTPAINGATFTWNTPTGITITSGQGTNTINVNVDDSFSNGIINVGANTSCGSSVIKREIEVTKAKTPGIISGPATLCGVAMITYDDLGNIINNSGRQVTYNISPVFGAINYTWTLPTGLSIVSGQGTTSIVVNVDVNTFVNGNISVTSTTSCTTSSPSVLFVRNASAFISGLTKLCDVTTTTYSVPSTTGSGFVWTVPSWMTISSGQNTNSITVTVASPICQEESVGLTFLSNCNTTETVSLVVGCGQFSKINPSQSGTTLAKVTTLVSATIPSEAGILNMYKIRIYDGSNYQYIENTTGRFTFTTLTNWNYGATYTVDVALKINGSYKPYGCASNITLPSIPLTQINALQCGTTLSSLSSNIKADIVPGSQMYRFEVSNGTAVSTLELNKYNFSLTQIPGITYGTTYGIRVAVKIAGLWRNFGPSCNVTTPALSQATVPTTKVRAEFCGTTLPLLATKIAADLVYGAEGYRFEVTKAGSTVEYDSSVYNFKLSQTSLGAIAGATYTIRVAAKVNGVYGNYGASCIVYTPADSSTSKVVEETPLATNSRFEVKVYPNPFTTNFKLDLSSSSESNVEVMIYDMIGRQLEKLQVNGSEMNNLELGNNYPSGVYNVIVSQGEEVKTLRVIKR